MDCKNACRMLSAYIDNELNSEVKASIERHIESCTSCGDELEILQKNLSLLKQVTPVNPSAGFNQTLYNKILDKKSMRPKTIGEIIAGWWMPVPTLCALLILLFVGLTSLAPVVYAKTDLKEMSKTMLVRKSIVEPVNFIRYCQKCHMMLCENCSKGEKCECK